MNGGAVLVSAAHTGSGGWNDASSKVFCASEALSSSSGMTGVSKQQGDYQKYIHVEGVNASRLLVKALDG